MNHWDRHSHESTFIFFGWKKGLTSRANIVKYILNRIFLMMKSDDCYFSIKLINYFFCIQNFHYWSRSMFNWRAIFFCVNIQFYCNFNHINKMITKLASTICQNPIGKTTIRNRGMILRNQFYVHDWSHIYDGIYKF